MTNVFKETTAALLRAHFVLSTILIGILPFSFRFSAPSRAEEPLVRGLTAATDKSRATAPQWRVFLAATNRYPEGIRSLHYAESDVDDLRAFFKSLGVQDENITVLKSTSADPYKTTLKDKFDASYQRFLASLTENSIAFVFLSGHGFCEKDENGEIHSYYAAYDFRFENDDKKISIDQMTTELAASKARFKWICVDACRAPLDRGSGEKSLTISDVPKGVLLTQSCSTGEYSYEAGKPFAPYNNGLFTRAFIDAVAGSRPKADVDVNGVVTLGELRDYLASRVPKDAKDYCQGKQNPTFTTADGGDLNALARFPIFEKVGEVNGADVKTPKLKAQEAFAKAK